MSWFTVRDFRIQVAGLLVFALALSACGRTGPIHASSSPEPTAAPGAPTLLIRLDRGGNRWGASHAADYLSDGTVIRWSNHGLPCEPGLLCGGLESNTLTPAGLAVLRARLAQEADLLAGPRDLKPRSSVGGPEISNTGVAHRFVLERSAGDRFTVTTPGSSEPSARDWVLGPDIERLNKLAEVMLDPESLIGPEGLAHAWTTYRPAKMAIFIKLNAIAPQPTQQTHEDGTVSTVFSGPETKDMNENWPFDAEPHTFGTAFEWPDGRDGRCGFVDGADLDALAAIILAWPAGGFAAGDLAAGLTWGGSSLAWDEKTGVQMWMVALMPDDISASCADAYAY